MRYLLDTCVLLWVLADDQQRLTPFRNTLTNTNYFKGVSVVTYWEIMFKKSIGKLKVPQDIVALVEKSGFTWLDLIPKHITLLERIPRLHNDPFDRLLIAQAKSEHFQLLTPDKLILQYFVSVN